MKTWLVTFERTDFVSVVVAANDENTAEVIGQKMVEQGDYKKSDVTCPHGWEHLQTEEQEKV